MLGYSVDTEQKQLSLLAPVHELAYVTQLPLRDAVTAQGCGREKEQALLNIGSQVEQVHDLGHARFRHATEPGDVTVVPPHSAVN